MLGLAGALKFPSTPFDNISAATSIHKCAIVTFNNQISKRIWGQVAQPSYGKLFDKFVQQQSKVNMISFQMTVWIGLGIPIKLDRI